MCDVAEPTDVMNPTTIPAGIEAVSEGVRSWATMTTGRVRPDKVDPLTPITDLRSCVPMSRMSVARCEK